MTEFSEHRIRRELSFEPETTAVLVVDMLKDFLDPDGAMPLPEGRALYEPINALLDAARRAGSTVIWVCDEHLPDDKEFEKRSIHCLAGTEGAEVVEELVRLPGELRVPKTRYSGFYETTLETELRRVGIHHVVIVGVVTNICVRSTAHDAFFRGYNVIVPEDCVAATSGREQASTLYDIDTHYGTVTGVEPVVEILLGGDH